MTQSFLVRTCGWKDAADELRRIRYDVFVIEQRVPEVLEWDAADSHSIHALATDTEGAPIGCARLLADGHIGRVAVVRQWRTLGVGTALMLHLIDKAAARGDRQVIVNAQVAVTHDDWTLTAFATNLLDLTRPSIGWGAMFFPPAVTIRSFFRSVILRKPSGSISPMSPVWNVPSASSTSAVASGFR